MPHQELWHQLFAEERTQLCNAIGVHIVAIEHIGSTSICGLSAKPIIDIAVAVQKLADVEKCIAPIGDVGYEYRGESGIPGRHYFVKGKPRTHHVHMVELDSDLWRSHLWFRDYLRQHTQAAKEYENLKMELAEKYKHNREAYTEGKSVFIENVLAIAGCGHLDHKKVGGGIS
jgi:GrpB-like predicted nucleotidyltransferase (UPF0157 family)